MAYIGQVVPVPMGQGGLHTDDSPSSIPPTELIIGNNVSVSLNQIEKFGGSARLNTSAFPSTVHALFDYWPNTILANRKQVVFCGDGKTYALVDAGTYTEITATGVGTPATLVGIHNQVFMCVGGAEAAARSKKLFILTGSDPVQVITGSGATRTNISKPPSDWSGTNQPSWAINFRGRIFAGGNLNNPHGVYASSTTDHEDYTTLPLNFQVYPGEGQKLIGATIFKGRLYVYKYPYGVYYLEDSDPSSSNWYFKKSAENFGFASAHSVVNVLNDVLVKNASDSITSIVATLDFGDTQAGDVFTILKIRQFMQENTNPAGMGSTHGVYYPYKQLAMFTYQSDQSSTNDRILSLRVDVTGKPKATFFTKDAPNCLSLMKDSSLIDRPVYGSTDGYVYVMDQNNFNVNNTSYLAEFQTPDLDFGFKDGNLAALNKNFDFLELRYVPQGDWSVFADIIIDGNYTETIEFPMSGDDLLADDPDQLHDFMLSDSSTDPGGSELAGEDILSIRKRIHGTGRTISVRVYNSGLDQGFKIATMIFSFRPSGEQQR